MAKSASRPRDTKPTQVLHTAPATNSFQRARPWLLAGAAMLLVARPLIPSVNVEHQGNDAPFVLLWLILLTLAITLLWRKQEAFVRAAFVDFMLLGTVAFYAISGLVAYWRGAAPRPAINMTWTWVGYGTAFVLVRQLLRTPAEARALAALMIALAAASCGYALHEYFISQPMTVAQYELEPDTALREAGMWFPPGSRERYLFEQRLRSTEPTATFALANSLAGFLTPWLVVVAGALATLSSQCMARRRTLLTFAAIGVVMLLVLLLTKSRSALVGLAVGLALHAFARPLRLRLLTRRAVVLVGLLLFVVILATAAGGIDVEVLAEAPKSLAYRFEYWRSTWSLITTNPIWGVGPGEFKDAYASVKLPTASEEISDPHNALLEIWATGGTIVAVTLVLFVGAAIWRAWHHSGHGVEVPAAKEARQRAAASSHGAPLIAWGGLGGFLLAYLLPYFAGPVIDVPLSLAALLGGLAISAVVLALLWSWIASGSLPALVPVAGLVALLVNLLAAGGIGHPGVAGSLFLLAALATTSGEIATATSSFDAAHRLGPKPLAAGICLALALSVASAATFYYPVVTSQLAIAAVEAEPNQADLHLDEAVAADPFGYDAPRRMAQWRFEQWRAQPSELSRKSFAAAAQLWLERRPHSSEAWSQVGAWQFAIFERYSDGASGKAAVAAYRRAIELYPNHCVRHAQFALVLSATGDRATARAEAAEALRLDAIMPHAEQRLDEQLRLHMRDLTTEDSPPT